MAPARITVARIDSPFPERPDRGLAFALVPGLPVDRFNRTWRLEVEAGVMTALREGSVPAAIAGRLGFDKTTGIAPAWDDDAERFVPLKQHDGDVVPFLLRTRDLSIAFQRTSKIKRQSFIGALQRLLREGAQHDGWVVKDRTTERSWGQFKSAATVVTEVTIVVRPTNPGWSGQELFEPYIEELGGKEAKITVRGDDLNLDSDPMNQARTHAIERGYGVLEAKGTTDAGLPVKFDSDDPVPVVDANADREPGGTVSFDRLAGVLADLDGLEPPPGNADQDEAADEPVQPAPETD